MIAENLNKIYEKLNNLEVKHKLDYKVKLVAVSKTYPAENILTANECGQVDFGENRVIEAYNKFKSDILKNRKINLHILGHLQRNKAKEAVLISSMIQSVDKIETLDTIEMESKKIGKAIDYLVEVNTSLEAQKYGVLPDLYYNFIDSILKKNYKYCKLRGLMTIAPFSDNAVVISKSFRTLFKLFEESKRDFGINDFNILSMGMSSDFEIAVNEGSNMVRIGTAIFGKR